MHEPTPGFFTNSSGFPKALCIPHLPDALQTARTIEIDRAQLSDLSDEHQQLFERFGCGPVVEPRFRTIHEGFEYFASRQPGAVAVEHLGASLTYGELNAAAERLADVLYSHGIRRGDAVCLYLQRSIAMVVGILASLKLGAAYVPQHVGVVPKPTLEHIANVTDTKVILTLSALADEIPSRQGQTLIRIEDVIDGTIVPTARRPAGRNAARPDDRCFILFTSGTTGVPNGVQVTHRNVCNILLTSPGDLGIKLGTRVAQILSISFDMAAWEILGCLANGGTLIIRDRSIQDVAERADVIIATPSILNSIDAKRCRNVKVVAVAGEPCPRPLADLWAGFCRFYNSCGPTETTIVNTAEPHFPDKPILSIGRPTPNNTVYILDENLKPLPIGEIGEMWAGGDCVSAGYLANPDLTAERYRPDPFLGNGRMMFRTRDLGRWTASGELEHFGRVDDQVKIRGFRVELDSVSRVLEGTPCCEQAAALKFDDRNLVAFVSPEWVCTIEARQVVEDSLPYYCTPAFIIPLPSLPRTSRGKIDKRLLLELAREHQEQTGAELA